jgi:Pyruvate/2-oxoacid:ferredoxin oxidoreductase gamma subunit
MHAKLRDGAVVVLNSTVFQERAFEAAIDRDRFRVFAVPATTMAAELGNPLGASMVITGAYSAITGLVGIDACMEAMRDSVPSYRQQHVAANETALRAGFEALEPLSAPAWEGVPA